MFSKARLDTVSDGIFGVAMTLLILDVRLPDDFHSRTAVSWCRAWWWLLYHFPISCVPFTRVWNKPAAAPG